MRRVRWYPLGAAVLSAALAAGLTLGLRDEPRTYGYHRCDRGAVCFFSEPDGNGEMCAWTGDDPDWLAGAARCPWTRTDPVRSVFNNNQETTAAHDVAYFRGADWRPAGFDLRRDTRRTGCTAVNQQGNLQGGYAPRSHRWVRHC
ncbi:hypothetical protein GTW43_32280 [Streptomyces sp. SID5785]|nr:hypothetical protein [Streptomyces sp. SID5785]